MMNMLGNETEGHQILREDSIENQEHKLIGEVIEGDHVLILAVGSIVPEAALRTLGILMRLEVDCVECEQNVVGDEDEQSILATLGRGRGSEQVSVLRLRSRSRQVAWVEFGRVVTLFIVDSSLLHCLHSSCHTRQKSIASLRPDWQIQPSPPKPRNPALTFNESNSAAQEALVESGHAQYRDSQSQHY